MFFCRQLFIFCKFAGQIVQFWHFLDVFPRPKNDLSQDILVTAEDGKEDSKIRLGPDADALLSTCWKLVCLKRVFFNMMKNDEEVQK